MPDEQTPPDANEMQQGAEVAQAGMEAAVAEQDPAKRQGAASKAVKRKAEQAGFALSDDDCDRIGGAVVSQLRAAGAFDPPPEPLAPPPSAPQPAQAAIDPIPQPERPRSFAERFRSR